MNESTTVYKPQSLTPEIVRQDVSGQRFGKWLVIEMSPRRSSNGGICWTCLCDCGRVCDVRGSRLLKGNSMSCLFCNNLKHGLSKHPLYQVWLSIKARCLNPNSPEYKNYGGRNIFMCQQWKQSFVNFYNDMFFGYSKGLQIDRINNNDGYCKENCRWATPLQNSNNTRRNIIMTLGERSQTLAEWAKELQISPNSLYGRKIKLGWSDYECLTKKIKKCKIQ